VNVTNNRERKKDMAYTGRELGKQNVEKLVNVVLALVNGLIFIPNLFP
jgi:hypothetical protein